MKAELITVLWVAARAMGLCHLSEAECVETVARAASEARGQLPYERDPTRKRKLSAWLSVYGYAK